MTGVIIKFEREKFYPGQGLEPGPLSFRANALPGAYLRGVDERDQTLSRRQKIK